jgi:hypothetical protein
MKILVYSDKRGFSLPLSARAAKDVEIRPLSELSGHDPDSADIAYVDCSGMAKAALKKAFSQLRKLRPGQAWGVIDAKGAVEDPAALFHEQASDYIGPRLLKEGLEASRFGRVVDYANPPVCSAPAASGKKANGREEKFPGWKALKSGEQYEFHFLYAAIADAADLKQKIGDKRFGLLREHFLSCLNQAFSETEALAWMHDDSGILFLIPAVESQARAVLQACLRLTLNAPIIAYESFGLESPFSFVFALHRGLSNYLPPGKTGTLVSEDVNFIFHLGTKKAEAGRIAVSSRVLNAVPERLAGHFVPAGRFEGFEISKSRKFL